MRIPVDWLNEYLPNALSVKRLAEVLTDVGLEVEAIEQAGDTPVLDIKVMSNRGDCLSVIGIARELAVPLRAEVVPRQPTVAEAGPPASSLARVVLEDRVGCPRYSARIVRGVKIAPSPPWAQRRLEHCGLRPINNVVDATNLVMLELGQPLHAFDYRLLRASPRTGLPTIIVRRARPGERLVTIDGEERELTPDVLLITDTSGPIALAGIMGGSSTEIHEGTTQVLLESAHFEPRTIRRGARALHLSTEASYRFERCVDPGGTVQALHRACELIAEFSEGQVEIAPGVIDACPRRIRPAQIGLRPQRASALLGIELSTEQIAGELRRFQLEVRGKRTLRVRVPTFRQDLKQEVDLVEEVARAHGYHNLPETLPRRSAGVGRLPAEVAFEREVRAALRGLGLSECVISSLESPRSLARLGLPQDHPLACAVAVNNAKTVDHSQLRTTLLTSLLDVLAHNRRHGIVDIAIFEVGRVYWSRGPQALPEQPQHLGIAAMGICCRGRWALPRGTQRWDFAALKGVVEALLQGVARVHAEYSPDSHPCLQVGRAARVTIGGTLIGHLGEVAAPVRQAYDLPDPVYFAELDLDRLLAHAGGEPHFQAFSRYPAVTRDVAFLVARATPAARAEAVIRESAGEELEALWLFDAYEGKPLPEGQRNLAFSLTFRRMDRTLTDEEVDQIMERVRASLRDKLGARLRE